MNLNFHCAECGAKITAPRARDITTVSCSNCGDVYFVGVDRPPRRFYPALHMRPITTPNAVESKWMPSHTRPIVAGDYEVKFRHTGDSVLVLTYHPGSRAFYSGTHRVNVAHLLTWRGMLA